MDVVGDQPAAHAARGRPARPVRAAARTTRGPTSCCARAATRSRAAPPRSSRTSSPSACSASRRRDRSTTWTSTSRRTSRTSSAPRASCSPPARRGSACARRPRRARTTTRCGRELVELGWPGIAIAEEHGGQGLGAVELAVLLEELGYALRGRRRSSAPSLAAAVIDAAGSDEQRARWLPGLASGEHDRRASARPSWASTAPGAAVLVLADGDGGRARSSKAPTPRSLDDDRPDAPLRAGDAATASRCGRRRGRAGPRPRGDRRRGRRRLPARAGHDARVRQGPQAVRGRRSARFQAVVAPLRGDAAPHGERALGGVLRGVGGGRRRRSGSPRPRRWPRPPRPTAGASRRASAIQAHGGIGFTWEADVHWLYKRAQLDTALLGGARRTAPRSPASPQGRSARPV